MGHPCLLLPLCRSGPSLEDWPSPPRGLHSGPLCWPLLLSVWSVPSQPCVLLSAYRMMIRGPSLERRRSGRRDFGEHPLGSVRLWERVSASILAALLDTSWVGGSNAEFAHH